MGGVKGAVAKQMWQVIEEPMSGEELCTGFCSTLHDALEFQEVPGQHALARTSNHGRRLAGAQQRLATGLNLGRIKHAPQASCAARIIGADEVDAVSESLWPAAVSVS